MARPKTGKEIVEVKFKLEKEDYEYLRKLLDMAGLTFAGTVRELVGDMSRFFRGVFGSDLDRLQGTQEFYIRKMVRQALVQMAGVLEGKEGE